MCKMRHPAYVVGATVTRAPALLDVWGDKALLDAAEQPGNVGGDAEVATR